jgi:chaperonin GroES
MKIRPLNDWALIRPDQEEEKSAGGIVIPDSAKEKPRMGEVLAIGPGRKKEERDKKGKVTQKKFEKTVVRPGQRVFYDKYGGTQIEMDKEELLMIREEDILGLVE